MASEVSTSAWLDWMDSLMGGKSRHTYAATFPPDRYYCLLDELPLHLVPQHAMALLRATENDPGRLILNPDCVFSRGHDLPPEIEHEKPFLGKLVLQGTIVWVMNRAVSTVLPFWLGPNLEKKLAGLRPGDSLPSSLTREDVALLQAATIIIHEDQSTRVQSDCDAIAIRSQALFKEKGYAPLPGLIHPFHVAALRRYYRCLIRMGAISLGDGQSARRYVAHNDSVARFFHRQITPAISAVAGEPLQPSYVYFASYLHGSDLKKHTDREQCEFSVTLCLDFSPEPVFETPWPIRLETASETVTVHQALGDGLAYRGTQLPHYRDVLGEGQTSTSIFFHYVSAAFRGSLD